MTLVDRSLTEVAVELGLHGGGALRCVSDHRQLRAGDVWFAWPGERFDPRQQLSACAALGLRALIAESEGLSDEWLELADSVGFPVYRIRGLSSQAGALAAALSGNQAGAPRLVAVTGTNGKTSVTRWVAQGLSHLKSRCAVLGTLGAGFVDGVIESTGLTTPDAVSLQAALAQLRAEGAESVALEASSIGLVQGRLSGCHLDVAAFTNLSRDHLDYHGNMQAYESAKHMLMAWPGLRSAVVNMDDPAGVRFLQVAARNGAELWQVASRPDCFAEAPGHRVLLQAVHVAGGMQVTLQWQGQRSDATVSVIGQFNLENLAVVAGILLACGHDLAAVADALSVVTAPPGRMQVVSAAGGPLVVVDYAHTPDALQKVLSALRPVAVARGGSLQCLFGCGGDRDPGKRPLMAAIAEQGADQVVITADNPRTESAEAIMAQMVAGLSRPDKARVQPDRAQAIQQCISLACASDVVLLAGKGHETGQIIGDQVLPFSDVEHAEQALARWVSPFGTQGVKA